jgi:hypothetical protein
VQIFKETNRIVGLRANATDIKPTGRLSSFCEGVFV